MVKNSIWIFASILVLISCKKKQPEPQPVDNYVKITVQPTYLNAGQQNVQLDSVYTTPEGYKVKFTDVKFYLTKLKNGNFNLFESAFFDFRETGLLLAKTKADYAQFSSLQGYIGVDSVLDHSFSFHIGTDLYRRDFSFPTVTWQTISATEKVFPLKLDLWKFLHNPLDPIDLKTQFLTHTASGQQMLTEKVTSNFQQSLVAY